MSDQKLAQEIANQMNLRVPRITQQLARRMRESELLARHLKDSKMVVPIQKNTTPLMSIALSTKTLSQEGPGGMIYLSGALACGISQRGNEIEHRLQDSRIDLGCVDYLTYNNRITWKEYDLFFSLLESVLTMNIKPELIISDLPLLMTLAKMPVGVEDRHLLVEWKKIQEKMNHFYQQYGQYFFPQDPKGPFLIYLSTGGWGSILELIQLYGMEPFIDSIEKEAEVCIKENWETIERLGTSRILYHLIKYGERSVGFGYEYLGLDRRIEPQELMKYGLSGLYLRLNRFSPLLRVEIMGSCKKLTSEDLNRLAGYIQQQIIFQEKNSMPISLWYAKKFLSLPQEYLAFFTRLVEKEAKGFDEKWTEDFSPKDFKGGTSIETQ